MKKMRLTKVLAVLALASSAFLFAGCGKKPTETDPVKDDTIKVDGFTIKVFGNEAEIVSIDPKGSSLVIPETLGGYKVTRMSYSYKDEDLTSVSIPASLTHLTGNGFMGCTNLSSVTFASGATISDIPSKAFQGTKLTSINIPASVKSISYEAFKDVTTLTTVTFESGSLLDSIGPFAFYNCDGITSINLPSNLKIISDSAFEKCDNLATVDFSSLTILETIDQFAFANCESLTTLDFSNSESLIKIGSNAFRGCTNISSIAFDDALREIGDKAFYNIQKVEDIVLPANITTIGDEAFVNAGLKTMEVKFGGSTIIGNNAFTQYDVVGDILIPKENQITSLKVDGSLSISKLFTAYAPQVRKSISTLNVTGTSIASSAFIDCTNISTLTIASGINRIGASAFEGCTSITSVTLNSGLSEISASTFKNCTSLEDVTLPDTVRMVGNYAFDGCVKVSNLDLSKLTSIGDYAFRNTLIPTPTFSPSITNIGAYAFYGCSEIDSVELNTNTGVTTTIKQFAFANCPNITSVVLSKGSFMESNVFTGDTNVEVLHTRGEYGLDSLFGESKDAVAKKITEIEILEGTTAIEAKAFAGCLSVTTIIIPETVTKIGNEAFMECRGITSLNLDDLTNLTTVGKYAFADCDKLVIDSLPAGVKTISEGLFQNDAAITNFTFNDGVDSIGSYAFDGCANLQIDALNDTITFIGDYAFNGCLKLQIDTLPENVEQIGSYAFAGCLLVSFSKTTDALGFIGDYAFKGCQSIESFEFVNDLAKDDNLGISILEGCTKIEELKIFGSTSLEYLFGTSVALLKPVLSKVTINAGSEELVDNMFNGFTALSVVDLTNCDIKRIGMSAFEACESLKTIDISKVDEIGDKAFARSGLESITIPANGIVLGVSVFEECRSLSVLNFDLNDTDSKLNITEIPNGTFKGTILIDVVLPDSVTSIGEYAFSDIYTLNTFTISENSALTSIGAFAFNNCQNILDFYIPKGVEEMGTNAFELCIALKNVEFDENNKIELIPASAFASCYALTEINLPASIREIGKEAFSYCKCLTETFILPASLETLGVSVFAGAESLNNLIIPLKVEKIPNSAFIDCYMLKNVIWNANIKSIGDEAFMNTPYETAIPLTVGYIGRSAFACKDPSKLPTTFTGVDLELGSSNGVALFIGEGAFYQSGLKSITLGSKVSEMDINVFSQSSLEAVNLEALVITMINDGMFEECSNLATVTLGDNKSINTIGNTAFRLTPITSFNFANIVSIGNSAFEECDKLKIDLSLGTSKNVSIGDKAFNKSGIEKLVLGEFVIAIGSEAFSECESLLSANLSALNITSISDKFFNLCTSLAEVSINSNIRTICANAFNGTAITTTEFLAAAVNLEQILESAFEACDDLTSATIPNTVSYVGAKAFKDCSALTSVTWSSNCNVINDETFNGCQGITSFTVPENVSYIGKAAFIVGSNLTLTFQSDTPPSVDVEFIDKKENLTITVPAGTKDTYLLNYAFSLYADVIA